MTEEYLVDNERYLKTGTHIGTRFKSEGMKKFIYKTRPDKIKVMEIKTIDERIRQGVEFISNYETEKIVVVSRRPYSQKPAKMFAELIGAKAITGRFVPGVFTNPSTKRFFEPSIVFVADPEIDKQAVVEAKKLNVPVIALCSTNNDTNNIDFIVPINNKGRKSLALVFWLFTREYLKKKGIIKIDTDFKVNPDAFEYEIKQEKTENSEKIRRQNRGRFPRGNRRER